MASAADDAGQPARAQHRYSLDPFGFENGGDVDDRGLLGDRDDVPGHHVFDLAAMRFDIIGGELVGRRGEVEPPGAPPFGAGFGAVNEIAFADHADHPVFAIECRQGADAALGQQPCRGLHRGVLVDRYHLARHHVHGAHRRCPNTFSA
jgi:hypothetical protein